MARVLIGLMTAAGAGIGGWARFAPHAFYLDFPVGGWDWVSRLGPYDEHLVCDFGNGLLALAAVSAIAACRATRTTVGIAVAGWEVEGILHLIYHLHHLEMFSAGQRVAMLAVLVAPVVVPAAAFYLAARAEPRSGPAG